MFDLIEDPGERSDLTRERPSLANDMKAELDRFVAAHRKEVEEVRMDPLEAAVVADRLRGLGYID